MLSFHQLGHEVRFAGTTPHICKIYIQLQVEAAPLEFVVLFFSYEISLFTTNYVLPFKVPIKLFSAGSEGLWEK
jgi:hypothetical protein